eukprot:TRINITY_DN7040_c0_g1_i1.p1 TRINITY_DN7040_c0_g1~~TRINITY_DN7040_c0_g1_i1.p1  ORF type:complete len:208 (+),score=27.41 TRINITY_DN7040_c0_g1_i1:117-740(+)
MALEKTKTFAFDSSQQEWVIFNNNSTVMSKHHTTEEGEEEEGDRLRVATFNILHNNNSYFREYFLQSDKRNNNMLKIITSLSADVICLNEVTISTLRLILLHPIIQDKYFISDIPDSDETTVNRFIHEKCRFGNILLSRLPFINSFSYSFVETTCRRKVAFGLFSKFNEDVLVGGLHITAYPLLSFFLSLLFVLICFVFQHKNFKHV